MVAFVLNTPIGVGIVGLLLSLSLIVTGIALVFYPQYYEIINTTQERILTDQLAFVVFLVLLVALPITLVFIG